MNQIPTDPQAAAEMQQFAKRVRLANQVRGGGSNFYWIAGLSLVNSVIGMFNGNITFVIGLAITLLIDVFGQGLAQQIGGSAAAYIKVVALVLNVLIASFFVLLGYFAVKGNRWPFIVGMILYMLDALIFLAYKDVIAFLFHLFLLWGLFTGWRAAVAIHKELNATQSAFPADIGS